MRIIGGGDPALPNVSYVVDEDRVYYNPKEIKYLFVQYTDYNTTHFVPNTALINLKKLSLLDYQGFMFAQQNGSYYVLADESNYSDKIYVETNQSDLELVAEVKETGEKVTIPFEATEEGAYMSKAYVATIDCSIYSPVDIEVNPTSPQIYIRLELF